MVSRLYWDKRAIQAFQMENIKNQEERLKPSRADSYALSEILAANNEPIKVDVIKQTHLTPQERHILHQVLQEGIKLFQGRGEPKDKPIHLELMPGATPSAQRPFSIP